MARTADKANNYAQIVEKIFFDRYRPGMTEIEFERDDIPDAAQKLGLPRPKNVGDVIYSFRFRRSLPETVLATQSENLEWIVELAGQAKYLFRLVREARIIPNPDLLEVKIPDATPEIVAAYALSDEQALLARVRYNRLIDIFLGVTAYSLQNHLRTTTKDIGQLEIDEVYVGIDSTGSQYILPVQAKGGTDILSPVQTRQDIACCTEKFPNLVCRAVSAQFMVSDLIALFELTELHGEVKILRERHYRLVPAEQVTADDLILYRRGNANVG